MSELNLPFLASQISNLHDYLQKRAKQQVNNALTIRNWLIGLYIIENFPDTVRKIRNRTNQTNRI